MSSHHIVRDDQEPAVIVASPPGKAFTQLAEMFEWSPVVVVLEEALEGFLQWDTKLDVVIGNQEKLEKKQEILTFQHPYSLIDSLDTHLFKALEYLKSKGHTTVHIFSTDLNSQAIKILSNYNLEMVFFDGEMKVVKSKSKLFSKWVSQNTSFKILNGKIISHDNLIEKDGYLVAKLNGFVNVFGEDDFWIGEKLIK